MKIWKATTILMLLAVLVAACGTTPSGVPTVRPGAQPTGVPAEVEVKIASFAFAPPSVTVKAGTTVKWTNEDTVSHTITADDGSWGSGSLGKGQSFSQVFTQAGTFTYYCTIHPSMKGTVVVTQ